jgi:hypothetical protein
MTSLVPAADLRHLNAARAPAFTLPIFVAALFLSAFLLFGVQPMFTKMVLPVLGGTPAVWSVAMVFFQALLLAGYLYAHLLTRWLDIRLAGIVHLALMASAFAVLPIALAAGWGKPPASGEAFWLLGVFAVSVGLPFFAIAGNAPLLQAWFARSGHPQARSPYFLYAASNIGSFAALISYPLAVEPFTSLREQSHWWTIGFIGVAVFVGGCALVAGRVAGTPNDVAAQPLAGEGPTTWRDRAVWIGLSFVPSGLLIAVTAYISTDVAAAPLLWVAPLALFLLSFVLAFRGRASWTGEGMRRVQVWGTALVLLTFIFAPRFLALVLHLGVFFVNALVCHATLYERRPSAEKLTEFYLCMSLGGVLGGIFCGLVAPHVFSTVIEYPILLAVALIGHKSVLESEKHMWAKYGARAALACVAALVVVFVITRIVAPTHLVSAIITGAFVAAMMSVWRVPQFVVPLVIGAVLTGAVLNANNSGQHFRSFFGVHKVKPSDDGRFVQLFHGTTLHGAMRVKNDDGTPAIGRPEPTTYFTFEGAIGTAVAAARAAQGGKLAKVTVIGLGSGSLSCHARPGESWTFLEIDPLVVRIAREGSFRFLRECAPAAPVVLGDARLTLADQPGGNSLIVIDAFSSDAIPTHLLTKEALALYLSRLAPDGVVVFHISNRYLDLRPIVARVAAEHGLVAHHIVEYFNEPFEQSYRSGSMVMALARDAAHLGAIAGPGGWRKAEPDMSRRPWTDDYSNILEAIIEMVWPRSASSR